AQRRRGLPALRGRRRRSDQRQGRDGSAGRPAGGQEGRRRGVAAALAVMSSRPGSERAAFSPWEVLPALGVAAALLLWVVPALRDVPPDDLRVFYEGGTAAWQGHPERTKDWTGMAFLALVMALVSRAGSLRAATVALNLLNITLILAGLGAVWYQLRPRLP